MDENDIDKPQDNKGQKKSTRQHDGGAADLEKVTDYEEERVVLQDIHAQEVYIYISLSSLKLYFYLFPLYRQSI